MMKLEETEWTLIKVMQPMNRKLTRNLMQMTRVQTEILLVLRCIPVLLQAVMTKLPELLL